MSNPMRWKYPALWVGAAAGLAVGGVAAGLVVRGASGALVGVVLGALVGVLAVFWGSRQAKSERQQAARLWDAIGEPTASGGGRSPAGLLRPEQAVVPFTGREAELGLLRKWATSSAARSVQVLVGAGGTGKTRLALQVASESGGPWRLVAAGAEGTAMQAARGWTTGPVLLVLDYAETRVDLARLLQAVMEDPGPVRVLLLARSLGDWWDELVEQSPYPIARLLTEVPAIRLDAPLSDAALAAAAVPCFAHALGLPVPERVEFELPTRRVPVLVLHAAALVAVLRSAQDPPGSPLVNVAGAMDELLGHEFRYWRRSAVAAGLPEGGQLVKQVVAAAALLGAESLADAAQVAGRVPDLADAAPQELLRWARWLYELYPAGAHGQLGSLQPNLLAETHVAEQLASDRALALGCLRGLMEGQAVQALTVLARAWAHHPDAEQVIVAALHDDLGHLAIPAATVTVQTRAELGGLLEVALRDAPASMETLVDIAEALPSPSVVLGPASLTVTLRIRASLPPGSKPQTVALWDQRAGVTLVTLGRPAEALPVTGEAVAVYRELAAASPDRYFGELAQSLSNLGILFAELGRPAEALPVTEEAVMIRRELAAASPDRYRGELAQSLSNLGILLSGLGRPVEALPVTGEAVAVYRELAAASPDRYRPDLAAALNNLGIRLAELGRPAEALPVTGEAVAVYRELAAASPDRYRPDLAAALNNLGIRLAELGRPAEALPVTEEAVMIRRELAAASPDRYRGELAQSLSNLGILLSGLGRPVEALPVTGEAVAVYRELAAASPDRYRPDLAAALNNLGIRLAELGRPAEALPVTEEAVMIRRELAAANPDRYRPDLAAALNNLGILLSELGRPAEALPVTEEAVMIRRELAAASPNRYRPDLAAALNNLGILFSELGRPAEALPVIEEAVTAYRELAAANPDRYRPDLAAALNNLGILFSELGRPAEALPVTEEAVTAYRELTAASPDRYRPAFAQSLSNLGIWLWELGRPAEALPPAQEATTIRRELASTTPERYDPELVQSLSSLAGVLSALSREGEAEDARAAALAIREGRNRSSSAGRDIR